MTIKLFKIKAVLTNSYRLIEIRDLMGACQSNPNVIVSKDKVKPSPGVRTASSFEGTRRDYET